MKNKKKEVNDRVLTSLSAMWSPLSFLASAEMSKKLKQHLWHWQASWKLWAGQQVGAGTRGQPQRRFEGHSRWEADGAAERRHVPLGLFLAHTLFSWHSVASTNPSLQTLPDQIGGSSLGYLCNSSSETIFLSHTLCSPYWWHIQQLPISHISTWNSSTW